MFQWLQRILGKQEATANVPSSLVKESLERNPHHGQEQVHETSPSLRACQGPGDPKGVGKHSDILFPVRVTGIDDLEVRRKNYRSLVDASDPQCVQNGGRHVECLSTPSAAADPKDTQPAVPEPHLTTTTVTKLIRPLSSSNAQLTRGTPVANGTSAQQTIVPKTYTTSLPDTHQIASLDLQLAGSDTSWATQAALDVKVIATLDTRKTTAADVLPVTTKPNTQCTAITDTLLTPDALLLSPNSQLTAAETHLSATPDPQLTTTVDTLLTVAPDMQLTTADRQMLTTILDMEVTKSASDAQLNMVHNSVHLKAPADTETTTASAPPDRQCTTSAPDISLVVPHTLMTTDTQVPLASPPDTQLTTVDSHQVASTPDIQLTSPDTLITATDLQVRRVGIHLATVSDTHLITATASDTQLKVTRLQDTQLTATRTPDAQLTVTILDTQITAPTTLDTQLTSPITPDTKLTAPTTPYTQLTAPTTPGIQLTALTTPDIQLTALTTPDTKLTAPATPDTQLTATTTTDTQLTAVTTGTQLKATTTPDIQLSAVTATDTQLTAAATDTQLTAAAPDTQLTATTPDTQLTEVTATDTQLKAVATDKQLTAVTTDTQLTAITTDTQLKATTTTDIQLTATIPDIQLTAATPDTQLTTTTPDTQLTATTTPDTQFTATAPPDTQLTATTTLDTWLTAATTTDTQLTATTTPEKQLTTTPDTQLTAATTPDTQLTPAPDLQLPTIAQDSQLTSVQDTQLTEETQVTKRNFNSPSTGFGQKESVFDSSGIDDRQKRLTWKKADVAVTNRQDPNPCHNPYPCCYVSTCLYGQQGKLTTILGERYIMTILEGAPVLVCIILQVSANHISMSRLLWRGKKAIPVSQVPDGTQVEFDAICSPSTGTLMALIIWQGTKPTVCVEPAGNESYVMISGRGFTCGLDAVDEATESVLVNFNDDLVCAEVSRDVVFVNGRRSPLSKLNQHGLGPIFATVFQLLKGNVAGSLKYVCTCLWTGQVPEISQLPMDFQQRQAYVKKSHGLYTEANETFTLFCDVSSNLKISENAYKLTFKVGKVKKSLTITRDQLYTDRKGRTLSVTSEISLITHISSCRNRDGETLWTVLMGKLPSALSGSTEYVGSQPKVQLGTDIDKRQAETETGEIHEDLVNPGLKEFQNDYMKETFRASESESSTINSISSGVDGQVRIQASSTDSLISQVGLENGSTSSPNSQERPQTSSLTGQGRPETSSLRPQTTSTSSHTCQMRQQITLSNEIYEATGGLAYVFRVIGIFLLHSNHIEGGTGEAVVHLSCMYKDGLPVDKKQLKSIPSSQVWHCLVQQCPPHDVKEGEPKYRVVLAWQGKKPSESCFSSLKGMKTQLNRSRSTSNLSSHVKSLSSSTSSFTGLVRPQASSTSSLTGLVRPQASSTSSLTGLVRPQTSSTSSLSGLVRSQSSSTSSLTGLVRPQNSSTSSLTSQVMPQTSITSSLAGQVRPQTTSTSSLTGLVRPQTTSTSSLTGQEMPQHTNTTSLRGQKRPQTTSTSSLTGQNSPKNNTCSLTGQERPQSTSSGSLAMQVRPQTSSTSCLADQVRSLSGSTSSLPDQIRSLSNEISGPKHQFKLQTNMDYSSVAFHPKLEYLTWSVVKAGIDMAILSASGKFIMVNKEDFFINQEKLKDSANLENELARFPNVDAIFYEAEEPIEMSGYMIKHKAVVAWAGKKPPDIDEMAKAWESKTFETSNHKRETLSSKTLKDRTSLNDEIFEASGGLINVFRDTGILLLHSKLFEGGTGEAEVRLSCLFKDGLPVDKKQLKSISSSQIWHCLVQQCPPHEVKDEEPNYKVILAWQGKKPRESCLSLKSIKTQLSQSSSTSNLSSPTKSLSSSTSSLTTNVRSHTSSTTSLSSQVRPQTSSTSSLTSQVRPQTSSLTSQVTPQTSSTNSHTSQVRPQNSSLIGRARSQTTSTSSLTGQEMPLNTNSTSLLGQKKPETTSTSSLTGQNSPKNNTYSLSGQERPQTISTGSLTMQVRPQTSSTSCLADQVRSLSSSTISLPDQIRSLSYKTNSPKHRVRLQTNRDYSSVAFQPKLEYLTWSIVKAGINMAILSAAGKFIMVCKDDFFINQEKLKNSANLKNELARFPNVGAIFYEIEESIEMSGYVIKYKAFVAWAGKKPPVIDEMVKAWESNTSGTSNQKRETLSSKTLKDRTSQNDEIFEASGGLVNVFCGTGILLLRSKRIKGGTEEAEVHLSCMYKDGLPVDKKQLKSIPTSQMWHCLVQQCPPHDVEDEEPKYRVILAWQGKKPSESCFSSLEDMKTQLSQSSSTGNLSSPTKSLSSSTSSLTTKVRPQTSSTSSNTSQVRPQTSSTNSHTSQVRPQTSSLTGQARPQTTSTSSLTGQEMPQNTNSTSLRGQKKPETTSTSSLTGQNSPKNNTCSLTGQERPQSTSTGSLAMQVRPQTSSTSCLADQVSSGSTSSLPDQIRSLSNEISGPKHQFKLQTNMDYSSVAFQPKLEYLTWSVVKAGIDIVILSASGKFIMVNKDDFFINQEKLKDSANLENELARFPNVDAIFYEAEEPIEMSGYVIKHKAVVAWAGKKPPDIDEMAKAWESKTFETSNHKRENLSSKTLKDRTSLNDEIFEASGGLINVFRDTGILLLHSKLFEGGTGEAEVRLSCLYKDGLPVDKKQLKSISNSQIWHCLVQQCPPLEVKDEEPNYKVILAWQGKKPRESCSSLKNIKTQLSQSSSTGNLSSPTKSLSSSTSSLTTNVRPHTSSTTCISSQVRPQTSSLTSQVKPQTSSLTSQVTPQTCSTNSHTSQVRPQTSSLIGQARPQTTSTSSLTGQEMPQNTNSTSLWGQKKPETTSTSSLTGQNSPKNNTYSLSGQERPQTISTGSLAMQVRPQTSSTSCLADQVRSLSSSTISLPDQIRSLSYKTNSPKHRVRLQTNSDYSSVAFQPKLEYLTWSIVKAGINMAILSAAGKFIMVSKDDFFINQEKLKDSANLKNELARFPNVGAIFYEVEEFIEMSGYVIKYKAVVAWAGKKPPVIDEVVKAWESNTSGTSNQKRETLSSKTLKDRTSQNDEIFEASGGLVDVFCGIGILLLRSKRIKGGTGKAEVRLSCMYKDGLPVDKKQLKSIPTSQMWHCLVQQCPSHDVEDEEPKYRVILAWQGKKPSEGCCSSLEDMKTHLSQSSSTGNLSSPTKSLSSSTSSLTTNVRPQTSSTSSNTSQLRPQTSSTSSLTCQRRPQTSSLDSRSGQVRPYTRSTISLADYIEFEVRKAKIECRKKKNTIEASMVIGKDTSKSETGAWSKGLITEIHETLGRLETESGLGLYFTRECCFLYGLCLRHVELWHVLTLGVEVEYELNNNGTSVKGVWVGSRPHEQPKSLVTLVTTWCRDCSVPEAATQTLIREAESLSPSLFPTAPRDSGEEIVDISHTYS